jgi:hypothetical protein
VAAGKQRRTQARSDASTRLVLKRNKAAAAGPRGRCGEVRLGWRLVHGRIRKLLSSLCLPPSSLIDPEAPPPRVLPRRPWSRWRLQVARWAQPQHQVARGSSSPSLIQLSKLESQRGGVLGLIQRRRCGDVPLPRLGSST